MMPSFDAATPACLLAAIVDSSEDAIVSKDLNTIVTSWNKSAERMFGYKADEMIGQPISRLFPPDRLDEENVILSRILKGERVEHFETVRVRKDGTPFDVSLTISPVRDANGKIVGASKIARDISEQKVFLKRLAEANEALKRADRLKMDFLATLSHELRTPLTAILGWIQILRDSKDTEEIGQGIEVIERNVRLQAQLIEDLLDMSRIESGKITLDVQQMDLAGIVDAAVQSVRPAAESKGLRLTSTYGGVGGSVMGDRNRIQQVVWNLLTNAIKFTPRGGKVHVVIQRVNSHAAISVTDSGQGIDPDFLEHVFERFRQADASTTRKHGGLGIGLAIAKHLTELHGGKLAVSSPGLGAGATFTVELPLVSVRPPPPSAAQEDRNGEAAASTKPGDLQDIKVLVVDDDADSLDVLRRILSRNGANVRTAPAVDEALQIFAEFLPDLVLSDIGMPIHDGFDLIRRLRAMPGGRVTPAVALTALARSEDRTRALRAGFQMHVTKPVDAPELVAVVQNLAGTHSMRADAKSPDPAC